MNNNIHDQTRCWCDSTGWEVLFRSTTFGLLRCEECGSCRIDPPAITHEKESRDFYTNYYAASNGSRPTNGLMRGHTSRFWCVTRQFPDLLQVGDRVADIGCGDGVLCAELKAEGWPLVIGVDVSQSRIARARQRFPLVSFHDRPLHETNLAAGSLDLLVMDNVIEHLPNPLTMLQTLRRFLQPKGRLVVITPNLDSGHFRLLGRRWTPELSPHTHVFLFTQDSLRRLLQRAGFEVAAEGNFQMPFAPGSLWWQSIVRGDLKSLLWRALQETGTMYGRLIHAGPMLYAVAEIPASRNSVRKTR